MINKAPSTSKEALFHFFLSRDWKWQIDKQKILLLHLRQLQTILMDLSCSKCINNQTFSISSWRWGLSLKYCNALSLPCPNLFGNINTKWWAVVLKFRINKLIYKPTVLNWNQHQEPKIEVQRPTYDPHSYTKNLSLPQHPSFQHSPKCKPDS